MSLIISTFVYCDNDPVYLLASPNPSNITLAMVFFATLPGFKTIVPLMFYNQKLSLDRKTKETLKKECLHI